MSRFAAVGLPQHLNRCGCLKTCSCGVPAQVRSLVKVGQEAFLTQLLEIGFFHGGAGSHIKTFL